MYLMISHCVLIRLLTSRIQKMNSSNANNYNSNNNNNNSNINNNSHYSKRRYNNSNNSNSRYKNSSNRYNNTNNRYNSHNKHHHDNKTSQKTKFPAPKKNNIFDLSKYLNKKLIVRLPRQREVTGELKGFDPLMSLVLDNAEETSQPAEGILPTSLPKTRNLGTVIIRGRTIVTISPFDGSEIIDNPFLEVSEEEHVWTRNYFD